MLSRWFVLDREISIIVSFRPANPERLRNDHEPPGRRSPRHCITGASILEGLFILLIGWVYIATRYELMRPARMDRNASRRLIVKVVIALVVMVGALLALMATRAGLIDISPANIYKGMFLLIVGGALLNMVQALISSESTNQQDESLATEPEGSK